MTELIAAAPSRDLRDAAAAAERFGIEALRRQGFTWDIDSVPPAEWDAALVGFDDLHYEQTASFSSGLWGARTSHLVLRRDGVPVAGARFALFKLPAIGGLAFLRFGPFWRRHGEPADLDRYRAVLSVLVHEYCVRRRCGLTVIPRPHPQFAAQEEGVLAEFGFVVRRPLADPNRYLVALGLDEKAQMQSLEQKWRYNLRQALAHDFAFTIGASDADVAAFQALHGSMVERKKFHDTDLLDLIPALARDLPDALRPRVALASHQGRPVAGAIVGLLGDIAYYVYGASSRDGLPLKAGYALQWWIVRALAEENVRWYDLGGEVEEQGLRQFKKGLVGKRGAVVTMQAHECWTHPAGRIAADLVYGLRAARQALRRALRAVR